MRFTSLLTRLWSNWLTLLGSIVATISGFGIILLLVVGLSAEKGNPYLSIFVVLVLPIVFGIGLLLIGAGLRVERRHRLAGPKDELQAAFEAAFNTPSARRRILFVAIGTVATVGLLALSGHRTLTYMSSPKFCGTSCHVMQPEWDAYMRSPHSNVACAECHIGHTAAGEIKAKWNGIHQLIGVVTSTYERPVTAGVGDMLPAKDTCQNCHSPRRFKLDRVKLFAHYDLDKDNTPKFNAVVLRIGGLHPRSQQWQGIHWHASPDNQVKFEYLDPERNKIGKVTLISKGQLVAEYQPAGPGQTPIGEHTMDCIDCHNRPAHTFDFTPKAAVDRAIFGGAIDPKTPFIAEVSVALLAQAAAPREEAEAWFRTALPAAYQSKHPEVKPDPAALESAAKTLAVLYRWNVYPEMNLVWNRHNSNTGHKAEGLTNPGCFRCHDGAHQATLADGRKKKLSQDCDMCHTGLVFDENPAKFDDTLSAMIPGG